MSADTLTKLPRTLHFPALEQLSPGSVAAAHAPTPGGEAARLPAACNKQTQAWDACGGGSHGEGVSERNGGSPKGKVRHGQRESERAYRDSGSAARDQKDLLPLLNWNLKSNTPWIRSKGGEIWFQPQLGH